MASAKEEPKLQSSQLQITVSVWLPDRVSWHRLHPRLPQSRASVASVRRGGFPACACKTISAYRGLCVD